MVFDNFIFINNCLQDMFLNAIIKMIADKYIVKHLNGKLTFN